MKLTQYKHRNMYFGEEDLAGFTPVWSYSTLIGYISKYHNTFYTWGYGRYSRTTTKQITMLCHEKRLELVHASQEQCERLLEHYNHYL